MKLELRRITAPEIDFFQEKMNASFQAGVLERFGDVAAAPLPPADDLSRAMADGVADLWAILRDGTPVGAAEVFQFDDNDSYALNLLFIFPEYLDQQIGTQAWQLIEASYPNAKRWETHTPYFERRNLHFYINKCGFKVVEFYNESHKKEVGLIDQFKDVHASGFFRFEKVINP